jgi:hypothetical protein
MIQMEGEDDDAVASLNLDFENDILGPSCLTHGGEVRHAATLDRLNPDGA